ncbi:MAG: hypothetical protein ACXWH7_09175, partial [Thermoanaerobaculia bacterium]
MNGLVRPRGNEQDAVEQQLAGEHDPFVEQHRRQPRHEPGGENINNSRRRLICVTRPYQVQEDGRPFLGSPCISVSGRGTRCHSP